MNLPNNSPLALVKELLKDIYSDWTDKLKEYNAYTEFEKVYSLNYKESEKNIIVAFTILAYDYQSSMIEIRRDRSLDKERILQTIAPELNQKVFKEIITGKYEVVTEAAFNYCLSRKNHKFYDVIQLLEQSAANMRYASSSTEDEISVQEKDREGNKITLTSNVDPKKVAEIRLAKANILEKAIAQRNQANQIIDEIKKEYGIIEKVMEDEFDFQLTANENFDVECWADHIRRRNNLREKQLRLPKL